MDIKVLGPGCPKCKKTADLVNEAVAEAGVTAQIEKVTDAMKIAGYGVFGTPAVVVDGEVVVRPRMKITMSCDHRVIDGAQGSRFLQTLKGMLEEPTAIVV